MIPEQVGPYLIDRKIGSGGMGTVYLGHHEETSQPVAIKILPASLAREEGFVLRFTREIEAMQSLNNPHVVEVYDSGVDDETYYYAMEYVEGETLSQRLRDKGRMRWEDVIEYSVQICSALKAAHDAGIVHRDLKPSNLMITTAGEIKLMDFGVAQVFASAKLTKTGGIIGTAEYMSPEQAQGKRATKKSDLYSLGAVMYAMLTARPPFSGKTSMEVIQKHRFGVFDRPRMYATDIPHWLDDVVCQCLDKDPEKRFPDAYVLSLRLREIVKKVELSRDDQTSATGTLDGTAETIVAGGHSQAIGGTLMRDLLQAEIDRGAQGSPISQFFDNTWILVGLLILIITGGIYWYSERTISPEQQFAKGKELFEQGTLYWTSARQDYFEPLLEADPEQWSELIQPMLEKIEIQELKQDFGMTRLSAKRVNQMSDARRFLHMAREYYKLGDVVRAEQILLQLEDLLNGQSEYTTLRIAVQEILLELKSRPAEQKNQTVATLPLAAIERASDLSKEGKVTQAVSILQGLIGLYDGDLQAAEQVKQARQLLQQLETTTTESIIE